MQSDAAAAHRRGRRSPPPDSGKPAVAYASEAGSTRQRGRRMADALVSMIAGTSFLKAEPAPSSEREPPVPLPTRPLAGSLAR